MLEKTYDPASVEQKHYSRWEAAGVFEPTLDPAKEPFTIMMPPPNVTGTLHVGHALDNTLPDMLVRRARMQGKDAFYQPGTDHASIAVHVILEKQLAEKGTNRQALGRDKFMDMAWAWKEHSGTIITTQMRRLGVGAAWKRERFTMDEGLSKAVTECFVRLYEKGLIYRGKKLVNWDPVMLTVVSDLEVDFKDVQGSLWHIRYLREDGKGHITVATTRPETLFGDVAVAVHPDDDRYKALVGTHVVLPVSGRKIPVIADSYVDPAFGSGVVKITPAHDFNDFAVGQRHNLTPLNVFTATAHLNDNAPKDFQGLDRFVARKKLVALLDEQGLLEKVEPHQNSVGHNSRGGALLEPYMSEQWFVRAKPLADAVKKAVTDGRTTFTPEFWLKTLFHWLDNIEDWCISRQLWWGHRIPAWYGPNGQVHVGATPPAGSGWVQDADVLDTWFSSALWPFSTLGWPEQTAALKRCYPTDVIMPGFDILFFWVVRMMMMGIELMGEVPFKKVYLHTLIRDEHGQKMSKSKGNVLDPLTLVDQYGCDALRFTLASQAIPGQDIRLATGRIEGNRNFCTKIWNAVRFAEMNGVAYDPSFKPASAKHPLNQAIIAAFGKAVAAVDDAYAEFRFNDVAQQIYHFTWSLYCDWYLELTKPIMQGTDDAAKDETRRTMGFILESLMRLAHPVMPFITEEIWLNLTAGKKGDTICRAAWPTVAEYPQNPGATEVMDWLIKTVGTLRNARAENRVPPKEELTCGLKGASPEVAARYATYGAFITFLTKVKGFAPRADAAAKTDMVAVVDGVELVMPLEGVVDFAAEKARIAKEIEKFEAELTKINAMLGNEGFVARAPQDVVAAQKARRDTLTGDLEKLRASLSSR